MKNKLRQVKQMTLIIVVFFLSPFAYSQTTIHKKDFNQELIIPVVFHIVHKDPQPNTLGFDNEDLKVLLFKINKGFNEVDRLKIDPHYRKDIADCNIKFVLAKKDSKGRYIQSITWYKTENQIFNVKNFFSRQKLMSYGYMSDDKYLNIWITDFGGKIGFGVYPTGYWKEKLRKDGVAIDFRLVKEMFVTPIIHEIGHYFNLSHIWEAPMENNEYDTSCDNDDGIDDTPPQAGANIFFKGEAGEDGVFQFEEIEKVCGDSSTAGNYQNYMDYAYQETSMFTKGQKNKMRYSIFEYRHGLLHYSDLHSASILSNTKQRTKFGTRMIVNHLYPYGTITDRDMVELFNSIGILPTKENLEKIGLKIVANNKFEDMSTGEFVNQHQIYERLDTNTAKTLYKKGITKVSYRNHIGFVNPNPYRRVIILTNQKSKKSYTFRIKKASVNYGDTYTAWTSMPFGVYECQVYGYGQKLIRTFVIDFKKEKQLVKLHKNGLE